MGIFDEPVADTRVSDYEGPTRYLPGHLIDHKDVTVYQFRPNIFIIKDIDHVVNLTTLNYVIQRVTGVENCSKMVGDFIVIQNTEKSSKFFRLIIDKVLTKSNLAYDYMSGLPVEDYTSLNRIGALQIEQIE